MQSVDETEGNERLTAATGVLLVLMLAAVGVTIINLRLLIWEHLFIGLLVIGPVALKLASTGYRFARYYTGDTVYVRKGPPPIVLRVIGPFLVVTTLLVLASGVALLAGGTSARGTFFPIHKISFIVWLGFVGLHILGHLPSLPEGAGAATTSPRLAVSGHIPGRGARVITLAGALAAGLVLAVVLIPRLRAPGRARTRWPTTITTDDRVHGARRYGCTRSTASTAVSSTCGPSANWLTARSIRRTASSALLAPRSVSASRSSPKRSVSPTVSITPSV